MLIAHTFATDLQTRTLKDIQPQIASAMSSLLDQLNSEEAQIAKVQALQVEDDYDVQAAQVNARGPSRFRQQAQRQFLPRRTPPSSAQRNPRPDTRANSQGVTTQRSVCSFCQGWNRNFLGHTMASCKYISQADKSDIARNATRS